MADLSNGELSILLIAKEGQYLMPIGRWEQPVKALAQRGLLRKLDDVNYVITDAGSVAADKADNEALGDFLNMGASVRNAHEQARQSAEQAAVHLSQAAQAAALATGEAPKDACRKFLAVIHKRAEELLGL